MSNQVKPNDLYGDVYPASWFATLPSRVVRRGQRVAVDAFGARLVVWRAESGAIHVQHRFCPHMGASLAHGDVEGERLLCPFHRWEYDGTGSCRRIPYMEPEDIPIRARVATYPAVERHGWIWAFNGAQPTHEPPAFPEYRARGFTMREKSQVFENHPLLILENACDAQHFKYIHRVDFASHAVKMVADEPHRFAFDVIQRDVKAAVRGPKRIGGTITTSIDYVGASLIYGRVQMNDRLMFAFIAAPTPIARNRTRFTLIVAVKRLPWFLAFLNPLFCSVMARQVFKGATDDYDPVWKDMDANQRGVLVAEDRLQQRFRSYYHAHVEDVPPATRVITPGELMRAIQG